MVDGRRDCSVELSYRISTQSVVSATCSLETQEVPYISLPLTQDQARNLPPVSSSNSSYAGWKNIHLIFLSTNLS